MRWTALAVAVAGMLAACAGPEDNNSMAKADSNQPGDVQIPADGGDGSPAPPLPGTPPPGQPAPEEPAPVPTGSVSLSATPASAAAGTAMTLTLRNASSRTVGYNLCTSGLLTSGGTAVPSDRVCTMELRTLRPAASASYSWELPDNLAAGRYRFTTGIEYMESTRRTSVQSNRFVVTRP